jgi:hypothetical protein
MMDRERDQAPTVGTEVYDVYGEKLGDVVATHPDYIVIEKGVIFPDDLYIPQGQAMRDGDRMVVSMSAFEVKRQGWDRPPSGSSPDQEVARFPDGDRVQLDVDEDAG